MRVLRIGDGTPDGQLQIVDEDRLCFVVKIRNESLRTISKALVQEHVDYIQTHAYNNSEEVRDALAGQSSIDKYEYGYRGTLVKLAEMITGKAEVVNLLTIKR